MTPSGVHINKAAIAVIIGLLILILIGFKLRGGADTVVIFSEKDSGIKQQSAGLQNTDTSLKKKQEEEELRRKEEELKKKEEELKKRKEEELKKDEDLKKKEEELKKQKEEEAKKEEELKKKEEELKKQKEGGLQTEQDKNAVQNQTKKADVKTDTVQKAGNQTEKREEKKDTDLKSTNQTLKQEVNQTAKQEVKKDSEQKLVNQTAKQEVKKEMEQKSINQTIKQEDKKKSENMTASPVLDWKTVKLEDIKIPDNIISSAANMKVEEKEYKVLDDTVTISARTVKPEGKCKGGVLLLHGQKFKSEDWDTIKTLHYIGAMGYTPMAIDLPGHGKSSKVDVADRVKFMEELIKKINFTAPVIISPSMSGGFALPYIMADPKTADKRSHGYIPVAPVTINQYADKYPDLNIPAALVYGEKDSNFRDTVEKTLSKIPNSRLFMIKDAGHACYLDKPEEWHKILYVFLPAAFK